MYLCVDMLQGRNFMLLLLSLVIAVNQGYCDGQHCDTESGQQCTDCLGDACPEFASIRSTGECSSGNKCGLPCNSDSECSPDGGQCLKEVTGCGKCNHLSRYKCGLPCRSDTDCNTGNCWGTVYEDECQVLRFYCDNQSGSKCGQPCNEDDSECSPHGYCVKYEAQCGNNLGYCDFQSTNCGGDCTGDSNCSSGLCLKDKPACHSTINVGTYIGAKPDGKVAPSLQSIPKELNLIMLAFAKDADHDGNFKAFSEWEPQGLTKTAIEQDKHRNPNRKFLVSLGGTVNYGGTFEIKAGMTTQEWVSNAVQSIEAIITSLSADGAEIQFEGNTDDPRFKDAITGVLQGLHERSYLTAIGPYRNLGSDSTWHNYKELPIEYVDFVNLQIYGMQQNTVESVEYYIEAVLQYLGGDSFKLVAGFNSYRTNPQPDVALEVVNLLRGPLRGAFTWSIERSQQNTPPYCLEEGLALLLNKEADIPDCKW